MNKIINLGSESNKLKVIISNGKSVFILKPSTMRFVIKSEKIVRDKLFNDEVFINLIKECNEEIDFTSYNINDYKKIAITLITHIDSNHEISSSPINDFFIVLQNYINETNKKLAELVKPIASDFIKSYQNHLAPLASSIAEQSQKAFKSISIVIGELAKKAAEFAKTLPDDLMSFAEIEIMFSKYDLFIYGKAPLVKGFFPKVIEISKLADECVKRKELESLFLEMHDDELILELIGELIENPIMSKRKEILREIKFGFENEKYYLTIPVIFAQIDSIFAEKFKYEYITSKNIERDIDHLITKEYDNLIKKFFISKILCNFKFSEDLESDISRHAIMHGGDRNYGTKINCVKLIIIMNLILEYIDI